MQSYPTQPSRHTIHSHKVSHTTTHTIYPSTQPMQLQHQRIKRVLTTAQLSLHSVYQRTQVSHIFFNPMQPLLSNACVSSQVPACHFLLRSSSPHHKRSLQNTYLQLCPLRLCSLQSLLKARQPPLVPAHKIVVHTYSILPLSCSNICAHSLDKKEGERSCVHSLALVLHLCLPYDALQLHNSF